MRARCLSAAFAFLLLLAIGTGCDSSPGGGGGQASPAGYTQADLTGIWGVKGLGIYKYHFKFGDQGQLISQKGGGLSLAPFSGRVVVAPDGKLKGAVAFWGSPSYALIMSFSEMRFLSKDKIYGTMIYYMWVKGVGKGTFLPLVVKMGRYRPN